ncbi:hypothetical protein UFOVP94_15 [uncultured Caudovirales phage]|uniref:Uncharacterized protein n=1 Tax=uncultured Caudovirales phage TaxID=2100421 RepID=A0A6J7WFD2_9CAUD|nr:hypothetical protein UFOVP94_15 [uncultured Caudovirales phage]CAB5212550.1 hypothetical protein UFOVP186_28 [uncultured Caudovirales phage]
MQDQIEKLRSAGFSDADIKEYMDQQQTKNGLNPNETAEARPTEQDVPFSITPTAAPPQNTNMSDAATIGSGLNQFAGSHLGHIVEGAAAYKYGAPILQRALGMGGGGAVAPTVAPTTAAPQAAMQTTRTLNPSQLMEAMRSGQLPPQAASPAASAPGPLTRTAQNLGQLASRYGPVMANIARIGGVAAAGMTPGTLNANEDEELRKRRALGYVNPNGTNAINSGFANQLNSLSKRQ